MRATTPSSTAGTWCSNSSEPKVVRSPFVSDRSLMPSGSPCSFPSSSPRRTACSAALAPASAAAKSVATMALTAGLTASIRSRHDSSSSTGEISLRPIRRRSATASMSHSALTMLSPGCVVPASTSQVHRASRELPRLDPEISPCRALPGVGRDAVVSDYPSEPPIGRSPDDGHGREVTDAQYHDETQKQGRQRQYHGPPLNRASRG